MKKKYIILCIACVAVIVLFFSLWIYVTRNTQRYLYADPAAQCARTIMPVNGTPYMIEVAPGMRFKFDTGADISTLTEADADRLRSMGYSVKESFGPVMGRDGNGHHTLSMRRYTADIPAGGYVLSKGDSINPPDISYSGAPTCVLRNVDFAKADDGPSVIGLDAISKFKLEFYYNVKAVGFTDSLPSGCRRITDIKTNVNPLDCIWSPNRPYFIVSVDQTPNIYMVNTGLNQTSIKRPLQDKLFNRHALRQESIQTKDGVADAYVDDACWVDFGARSGTKKVYYYDNSEEDYQVNPFNVCTHNIIIDFAGKTVYSLPY